MTAFDTMRKHYEQRDLAAREWKQKGGKVVGYFCDNVPEEMILAAGLFPLRLSGDPRGGTEKVGEYTDLGLLWSREGFAASMLHMLLTGKYDFLDYLVVPHARDSVHRMYPILLRAKESGNALKDTEIYFLENLHTTFYSSGLFNRDRWLEFKERLTEWSGQEISGESLSQAISITNENKMLLKQVAGLRTEDQPRISGVEALTIIGSSMFMLKEEHNILLREFLGKASELPARNGARLFVEGSPLDNLQLYEVVESCDATIVTEDNCWGNRYSDVPIDISIDPVEAIVERYNDKSPCPRMFPMTRRVEYCLRNALEAKVQGCIFYVYEFDDIQAWETPDEIKALEEKGIPVLYLKKQPYLISEPDMLKSGIEKFIQRI
ncbi:2-hydroxyacyl-CoA dehydratase subunit D [Thermodesulfobacteriota bacterium]